MSDYSMKLYQDLAEQFKKKENIKALVEVIGDELQELFDFYSELFISRGMYTAVGKQLDGMGDIVCLSRKEAAKIEDNGTSTVDDETYRKYLIYKVLKNTCDCSYNSLIRAIQMFWKSSAPVKYKESILSPATIFFEIESFRQDARLYDLLKVPFVKAAGVGVHINTEVEMDNGIYVAIIPNQEIEQSITADAYTLP